MYDSMSIKYSLAEESSYALHYISDAFFKYMYTYIYTCWAIYSNIYICLCLLILRSMSETNLIIYLIFVFIYYISLYTCAYNNKYKYNYNWVSKPVRVFKFSIIFITATCGDLKSKLEKPIHNRDQETVETVETVKAKRFTRGDLISTT